MKYELNTNLKVAEKLNRFLFNRTRCGQASLYIANNVSEHATMHTFFVHIDANLFQVLLYSSLIKLMQV